jgi:hypothetical protein
MKMETFSRLTLVLGLSLGFMIVCVTSTPSAMGTNSLLGGWGPVGDDFCCTGTFTDDCSNAMDDPWTVDPNHLLECDAGNVAEICDFNSTDEDTCSPGPEIPCPTPSFPADHPCNTTHDGECPE